ncbi:Uncharacterized protein TCM_021645 [Theobroma cacao]|uniref:Uncharacterized protein n=1 Tax=Theobroma cacao TaxID=3641 RepID=A0A061ERZ3_THECC|nr:Uncharacterized protein TCM_021645 [Theobroma cacao]
MLCSMEKGAVTNDKLVVPYSLIRKKANGETPAKLDSFFASDGDEDSESEASEAPEFASIGDIIILMDSTSPVFMALIAKTMAKLENVLTRPLFGVYFPKDRVLTTALKMFIEPLLCMKLKIDSGNDNNGNEKNNKRLKAGVDTPCYRNHNLLLLRHIQPSLPCASKESAPHLSVSSFRRCFRAWNTLGAFALGTPLGTSMLGKPLGSSRLRTPLSVFMFRVFLRLKNLGRSALGTPLTLLVSMCTNASFLILYGHIKRDYPTKGDESNENKGECAFVAEGPFPKSISAIDLTTTQVHWPFGGIKCWTMLDASPLIIQSLADCSNWCHNHDTILDFLHAKASNLIFICCFPSAIRGLHSSTSL